MKKKVEKKWARAFLDGKMRFPTTEIRRQLSTDGDYCFRKEYVIPDGILREVHRIAFSRGWDGCHWDAPELLGCFYPGGEWSRNKCWDNYYYDPNIY